MFGRVESWMLHKKYLVTLTNGEAFSGIIERRTKHSVVLQQATQWSSAGEVSKVDGRLIIERTRVLYFQETSPPDDHQ